MRLLLLPLLACLLVIASCSGKRLPENCYLKPESGKCRASIMRWYLDERTGTCKAFVWGGCEGVAPFETQEACASQCMVDSTAAAMMPTGKNPPVPSTLPALSAPAAPAAATEPAAPAAAAP